MNVYLKLPAGTNLTLKATEQNGKKRKLDKHQRILHKTLMVNESTTHPSFLDDLEGGKRLRVDWQRRFHLL